MTAHSPYLALLLIVATLFLVITDTTYKKLWKGAYYHGTAIFFFVVILVFRLYIGSGDRLMSTVLEVIFFQSAFALYKEIKGAATMPDKWERIFFAVSVIYGICSYFYKG